MKKNYLLALFLLFTFRLSLGAIEPWPGISKPTKSEFKTFLHTGFSFDAVLKTSIFSFNTETPVIALAEYDILFLDKVVVPKGTKFIGRTSIMKTVDRVNVLFHTAVFPTGEEIPFNAIALHVDGSAGIPGKVKKETASIPARILLEAVGAGASVTSPVAGAAVRELSTSAKEELTQAQRYSISVNKDTPILVYVVQRIEY